MAEEEATPGGDPLGEEGREQWDQFSAELGQFALVLRLAGDKMFKEIEELPACKGTVLVSTAAALLQVVSNILSGSSFDALRGFVMLMSASVRQEQIGSDEDCEELLEKMATSPREEENGEARCFAKRQELGELMLRLGMENYNSHSMVVTLGEKPVEAAAKKNAPAAKTEANPNVVN